MSSQAFGNRFYCNLTEKTLEELKQGHDLVSAVLLQLALAAE